jgi:hypothetical protein
MMIVLVEQYRLGFESDETLYYFESTEAAADNDNTGFALISNTRVRGY